MFFPESRVRVFLYGQPTDMRKSYDRMTEAPDFIIDRLLRAGKTETRSRRGRGFPPVHSIPIDWPGLPVARSLRDPEPREGCGDPNPTE